MSALAYELSPAENFPLSDKGDYNAIVNKAFAFRDDRWNLSLFIEHPDNHAESSKQIRYDNLPKALQLTYKRFTYHLLGEMKPQSAVIKANGLKTDLMRFMEEYGLSSFKEFDSEVFLNFNAWLRETHIDQKVNKKEKPLKEKTLYDKALTLKQLLDMAELHQWHDAPKEPIYLGDTSLSEMWGLSSKEAGEKKKQTALERLMPTPLFKTLMNAAKEASPYIKRRSSDKNFKVYQSGQAKGIKAVNFGKYLVLTLGMTGLRVGEVMTLHANCVFMECRDKRKFKITSEKEKKNRYWLRRDTTKMRPEAEEGDIRIPKELYEAILELKKLTESYRERSGIDRLFFGVFPQGGNKITKISEGSLNQNVLPGFRKQHPLIDENGEEYHWKPHDLRHTFASILVNEHNISITTLLRHYAHLSFEMTSHYIHLNQETLKKRALAGFVHADKILVNGQTGQQFLDKLNEVRVEADIEKALSKLADTYGATSLPFGLCIYNARMGHCPNLGVASCWELGDNGCKDFVTSDSYKENFEHERDILIGQMERDQRLNRLADYKMKKLKLAKVTKWIERLQA